MTRSLLLLSALALSSCSPYDVCGPSTCADGCCTAPGECVGGTLNQACGTGGNACNVCPAAAPVCLSQVCRGSTGGGDAGVDAGMDAGAADAGSPVFVTFRYDIQELSHGGCPPEYKTTLCSSIKQMDASEFATLRLEYPQCNVSQTDSQGYVVDCTGNCAPTTDQCANMSTGMASTFTRYMCTTPTHANAAACLWTP